MAVIQNLNPTTGITAASVPNGGYPAGSYDAMLYNARQPATVATSPLPGSQTSVGTVPMSATVSPISTPYAQPTQQATPGSTVSTSGTTTSQMSGPNGPFSSLGSTLASDAGATAAAGQTALQTGMAGLGSTIYNQQLQQEQNQTNVNEAQRGITASPYGAGVANQADINFNSNWQNNQLARDQAGISAAASSLSPATGLYNSSYGSSASGYQTTPPAPQQPSLAPPDPSAFDQPTSSYNFPSSSQAPAVPFSAVTQQTPYQSPIGSTGVTQNANPVLTNGGQATGSAVDMSGSAGLGVNGVQTAGQAPQGAIQGPAIPGQTPGSYNGQAQSPVNIDASGQMQGPALSGQTPGTYAGQVQNIDSSNALNNVASSGASPDQIIASVPQDSSPSTVSSVLSYLGGELSSALFGDSGD